MAEHHHCLPLLGCPAQSLLQPGQLGRTEGPVVGQESLVSPLQTGRPVHAECLEIVWIVGRQDLFSSVRLLLAQTFYRGDIKAIQYDHTVICKDSQ